MAIGRHEPKVAHDIDLRGAILVGLDEAFTALEEGLHDLTDEQAQTFPVPGQNNIAWIVMHCLDNLDEYANGTAGGARVTERQWRWNLWQCRPDERPQPGDEYPSVAAMLDMLSRIRDAAMPVAEALDEEALTARWIEHPGHKSSRADFYMRTIYHTMAHTRDLWLLRGALGLASGSWPRQHWC